MVAESLRVLAGMNEIEDTGNRQEEQPGMENVPVSGKAEKKDKTDSGKKEKPVAVEDIRAVLAQKSQDGKTKEIKELLRKYGAEKLSAVKQEDYPALFREAGIL